MNDFIWGVYPYLCFTLFFIVPFIRMKYRPFSFTTRASGIFGRKFLGLAMLLMHWGVLLVFAGHIAGFVGGSTGDESWLSFFRITAFFGGLMTLTGVVLALLRRIIIPEVKAMSQPDDYIIHLFLIAILGIALYQYIVVYAFGLANIYSVAPWFASIWAFAPDSSLMEGVSLLTKWHVFLALTLAAYFPFTKLVHIWTVPINYFVRPYQSMRTVRNKFIDKWEFGLRSDKSFMLYILLFFFFGTFVLAKSLVGAGG